jgi:hypothetical protein
VVTGKSRRCSEGPETAPPDDVRDALVVPEEPDHRSAHAVGDAGAQRPEGGEVGEGHCAAFVRGEDGRRYAVENRLREAPPFLHAHQRGLEVVGPLENGLFDGPGRLVLRGLNELSDVVLGGDVVREPPRLVQHRRHGHVVPERLAVLAVVPEEDPHRATGGQGVTQVRHGGHVRVGAGQKPEVTALDLIGGIARDLEEGAIGVGHRVLRRPRVQERHPHRGRVEGALEEAQPFLLLPPGQESPCPATDEGRVEGLGEGLVGADRERHLHRPLRDQAHHQDGRLIDAGQRTDPPADRDPVHDRQERIEDDQIEVQASGERHRLHPVHGLDDVQGPDVEDLTEEVARRGVAGGDEHRRSSVGRLARP